MTNLVKNLKWRPNYCNLPLWRPAAILDFVIGQKWCYGTLRPVHWQIQTPLQLGPTLPPLLFPSTLLPFPSPSLPHPFPLRPLRSRPLRYSGSWAEPQRKSNLVHFSRKTCHLVAPILLILWPDCLTGRGMAWLGAWPDFPLDPAVAPVHVHLLTKFGENISNSGWVMAIFSF